MFLRSMLFLLLLISASGAEIAADQNSSYTSQESNTSLDNNACYTQKDNVTSPDANVTPAVNPSNIMDATYTEENSTRTLDMNDTLQVLDQYDDATAAGTLHTETEAVVQEKKEAVDTNSSSQISATTKLDDVSNLDIVKAQRKQRKIERQEEAEKEDTQSRALIDTIVVKGSVLQGQIDELTADYIRFKLIYGEGSIRINYTDVESLSTEHEYHIYFDGKETQGYITAIQDHAFLKVQHGEVEELITISKIDRFVVSENEDTSIENRLRNTFPYWSGNLDLGLEYESGSNEKRKLKVGGHVERRRAIHRTIFDITYSYEQTRTSNTPTVLNKNELYSFLEQDYSFTANDMMFVELGYDFDVPRGVDDRYYPSLGYGYMMRAEAKKWIQFKVGGGYVYEHFIGYDSNQYAAGFFGIDAEYEFGDIAILNRIIFGGHFFYMPGTVNLKENWLLRYSTTAAIPLSKSLVLKAVWRTVTDDNPAPEVGNNKTSVDIYLSLRF